MPPAQPRNCDVHQRQQRTEGTANTSKPLHTLLMRLHTLLQVAGTCLMR